MKKAFVISVWVILIVGMFFLLGFANKEQQSTVCNKLEVLIRYNSDDYFITENDVNEALAIKGFKIKGAQLSDISVGDIEAALYTIPFVERADVYATLEGAVQIKIVQKKPIVKVFNKYNQSFYIDDKGKLMPSSNKYTARLIVANGFIDDLYNPLVNLDVKDSASADTVVMKTPLYKVFRIAQFITNDDFWKAMVEEVFVNGKGDLELFTKIGDQTVIFGGIDDMDKKFENLLVFYKQGLNKIGWEKYKTINLKYNNQVVCSKI